MKAIAVTGTIGSGKSECSRYLRKLGYSVFDCDERCRTYLEKEGLLYQKAIDLLSEEILDEQKNIDRKKVAQMIFQDISLKTIYEQMFHQQLKEELVLLISENKGFFFAEVPLLYETGFDVLFDEVWLVWCDEIQAIERCMSNRAMKEEEVRQRIKTQMSVENKKERADVLLENNGSKEQLYHQIDEIVKELKQDEVLR